MYFVWKKSDLYISIRKWEIEKEYRNNAGKIFVLIKKVSSYRHYIHVVCLFGVFFCLFVVVFFYIYINKHFIHIGLILYPDAKGKKRSFIAYSDIHSMRRTNEIRYTDIRIRSKFQTTLLFRAGNKSSQVVLRA